MLLYRSVAVGGAQEPNLNFSLLSINIFSLPMLLCLHILRLGWLVFSATNCNPWIHALNIHPKKGCVRMCINSLVLSSSDTLRCKVIAVPHPGQRIAFPRPRCPLQCQSGVPVMGLKEWSVFCRRKNSKQFHHNKPCVISISIFTSLLLEKNVILIESNSKLGALPQTTGPAPWFINLPCQREPRHVPSIYPTQSSLWPAGSDPGGSRPEEDPGLFGKRPCSRGKQVHLRHRSFKTSTESSGWVFLRSMSIALHSDESESVASARSTWANACRLIKSNYVESDHVTRSHIQSGHFRFASWPCNALCS